MNADTIGRALGGTRSANGWKVKCPAHRDHTPSLALSDAEDGRVLVHCHAGCTQWDVIAALDKLGLWPNGEPSQQPRRRTEGEKKPLIPVPADAPPMSFKHPRDGTPSCTWPYHLADGGLAGYIARFDFAEDGKPDKDYLPITFCDLGGGRRGWRARHPRAAPTLPAAATAGPTRCANSRDRRGEGRRRGAAAVPRLRRYYSDARREVAGEVGLVAGEGLRGDDLAGPRPARHRLRACGG